jgi:PKD repeat protein
LSTGATEYAWNFGNGKKSTLTDPSSSYAQGGKYPITLVGKNSYNCSVSKMKELEVAPELVADFEMDTTNGCLPLAITFKNTSKGGVFYNWDLGDGNVSTKKNFKHTFTTSGFISVQLIAENTRGCKDTITRIVRPYPVPKVSFEYLIQDSCASPLAISLINNSIGVTDNQWVFGNNSSSTLSNPLTTYSEPGTYIIQLVVSNSYNCVASTSKEIVVHPRPKSKFELSKLSGCMPFTLEITNNTEYAKYYNWTMGDGGTSVTLNPKYTYEKEGKFEVKLMSTDQQGCKDSLSKSITVFPTPVAKFTSVSTDPCYYPLYVETNNQSIGATKYAWEFSNGILTSLTHPTAVFYKDGVHSLSLIAENNFGCKSTAKKEIESYKTPRLTATPYLTSICENNKLMYSVESENTKKVKWFMGNGDSLEGTTIKYGYEKQGTYNVIVIGEGDGGCSDTLELDKKIWVATSPRSNFETSQILNNGMFNGAINFTNNSQGAEKYKWVFGDGNKSDVFSPSNKYMSYGSFDVSLISFHQNGCTDTLTKKIDIEFYKGLFIPNAMYLGHQDYEVSHFVPKGVGLSKYEISIYDDWGNLIWRSTAIDDAGRPTESWDGTYKDQYVQQDSYVWKVDAIFKDDSVWEGKEYEPSVYKRSGTVTVIK